QTGARSLRHDRGEVGSDVERIGVRNRAGGGRPESTSTTYSSARPMNPTTLSLAKTVSWPLRPCWLRRDCRRATNAGRRAGRFRTVREGIRRSSDIHGGWSALLLIAVILAAIDYVARLYVNDLAQSLVGSHSPRVLARFLPCRRAGVRH